jgi:hypothetical protein
MSVLKATMGKIGSQAASLTKRVDYPSAFAKSAKVAPLVSRSSPNWQIVSLPYILWLADSKNTSNCVFFACHPLMAAVLTT